MNLKLKQLYLNRVEDDPVYDEELPLSEPQPRPDPTRDLLAMVVIVVLVGMVVWLVVVSWMAPVSA